MNDKKNNKWLHNRYGKNLNKMFAFQKAYPMIILNKIGLIYNQYKPSPIRTPSWIGTNTNLILIQIFFVSGLNEKNNSKVSLKFVFVK